MSIATERGDQQTYAKVGDDWIPVLHLLNLGEGDTVEIATMGNKAKLIKIGDDWIPVATLIDASGNPVIVGDYQSVSRIEDEFNSAAATSGSIGALGWNFSGGTATLLASEAGHPGILRRDTGAVSGTVTYTYLRSATSVVPADIFDEVFVIRLNQTDSDTRVRVGLSASWLSDPGVNGIYFEKLTTDTSWFGVARSSSVDTRTAAIADTSTSWVNLRVRRIDAGTIGFSINGGVEVTLNTGIPTAGLIAGYQIVNGAAASKTVDIDYFQMLVTGISR